MTTTAVNHGTYAGWNWHMREKVKMCIACREAKRQYAADLRQDPARRTRDREVVKANRRAQQRLAAIHPDEYRALYLEELNALREPQP
jgi:hypothetical protein